MTRRHPRTAPTAALVVAVVGLLTLAGCSSDRGRLVDPAALQPGACTAAGPPLNDLHLVVGAIEDGADPAGPVRTDLEAAQDELAEVRDSPDTTPEVRDDLDALVQVVGLLRFGLVSQELDTVVPQVDAAAAAVVARCLRA